MLIIVGNAMGALIVCGRINRAKVLAEASERCVFDQRAVIWCAENPKLKAIAIRIAYYNFDRMTFVISKVNFHTVLQSSDCWLATSKKYLISSYLSNGQEPTGAHDRCSLHANCTFSDPFAVCCSLWWAHPSLSSLVQPLASAVELSNIIPTPDSNAGLEVHTFLKPSILSHRSIVF
jgi:hypothetical protein